MEANTPLLDEDVRLAPPDPAWPHMARDLKTLASVVTGVPEERIEHIGSTAIAGLVAKPIIDLMAGMVGPDETEYTARRLSDAGWQDLGEAGVAGRRYLRCRIGFPVNVHLVIHSGDLWRDNINVRDYLRLNPGEAATYAQLKRDIVARGHRRLIAYSDAKSKWVAELAQRARSWREAKGRD
ncbi:GrpB family protein [Rhizobium leguminosarum]|uniref:GrpB family protein n=1 Tax=Rhizobium leguminosarum TaxID=384 RepID=UPI001030D2DB|nr:GrpB family protein [Rhizobium leguminosarum]TAU90810.1 GrpB family protein [Rhizobium leguminosarum]TAV55469.1 GrpB family protein [Rhizobium leguminosarum]TAX57710.1 GrpB family protein [Rhizobium leguminosarum]TAX62051.1 GrpB family protein [Rhizobium leguminosarum]TAY03580.1 GrpB family protein [Rhizobium leguminosarum]